MEFRSDEPGGVYHTPLDTANWGGACALSGRSTTIAVVLQPTVVSVIPIPPYGVVREVAVEGSCLVEQAGRASANPGRDIVFHPRTNQD